MQPVQIVDRGRGPEAEGTRITVIDVLPLIRRGWTDATIASWFRISSLKVEALREYIDAHREEVLAMEAEIRTAIARGNSPDIEARKAASLVRLHALREELQRKREREANGEEHPQ